MADGKEKAPDFSKVEEPSDKVEPTEPNAGLGEKRKATNTNDTSSLGVRHKRQHQMPIPVAPLARRAVGFPSASEQGVVPAPGMVMNHPSKSLLAGSKLDFSNDYRPQFAPEDETTRYCQINYKKDFDPMDLGLSWEQFLKFNPFDFPPKDP